MAALPSYVLVLLNGYAEQFDPGVVKSEMEKGLPKMRVAQSRVVRHINVTLAFESAADANAFEDWYFNTIKRIGWFDWHDPRDGVVRSVRFKDADIGQLQPLAGGFALAQRSAVLEYLR